MNASIPILSAAIGAVVLLFGRKLFWLCVAAIGFAAGVTLASQIVHEPTALLQLTFALLLGFIGAFQVFTTAYIITNGGPANATLFYSLYLYRVAGVSCSGREGP